MIIVGKKWDTDAQYIGRGSPLGNPFPMNSEADRDIVCDAYHEWIWDKIETGNGTVIDELNRLKDLSETSDLVLGCFCSPKRCHGDTIKEILEAMP